MKLLHRILPILPFLFVFIFSLFVPTDPDLGWHLKNGEYFFQNGSIIRENTYSTMMPDYLWANTSWFTDIITYGVYALSGFTGLSILGGALVALTFYYFSKIARLTIWDQVFLFPVILYLLQPVNSVSFRGQQISLLLIGVLFFILSLYSKRQKSIYLVIPLFLIWANLHGQFILGMGLFALWIFLYFLQKSISIKGEYKLAKAKGLAKIVQPLKRISIDLKKNKQEIITLLSVFVASFLVTFINPFGWGIHSAALSHFGSPLLQYINEYLPFEMLSVSWWGHITAGLLLVLGFLVLLLRNKVRDNLPLLGAGIVMFVLSLEIRRYAWPAYYLILPLLSPLSAYLRPDSKKMTHILSAIFAILLIGMALISKYPFTQFTSYSWQTYCVETSCSPKAAEFILKENLTKNLYTEYGWGGWLIWNYPEIKPVIDGRMHLWEQDGYSAFEDYYALEQNNSDIDTSNYNAVLISPTKALHERLIKLENAGKWKMVYSDNAASVFVRK